MSLANSVNFMLVVLFLFTLVIVEDFIIATEFSLHNDKMKRLNKEIKNEFFLFFVFQ